MLEHLGGYLNFINEQKGLSENTFLAYKRDLTQYLNFLISNGIVDINKAGSEAIQKYIDHLREIGKSQTTVQRLISSLKSFYKYLMSNNIYEGPNPTSSIKAQKPEHTLPDVLTVAETELLLSQPKGKDPKAVRDKAILELLYATGMRISELIALDVSDINFDMGFARCKSTSKDRIIPIYPSALKCILNYCKNVRRLIENDPNERALFLNLSGERLTRQGAWKIIRSYTALAGINKKITPHTLRHSFAAHIYENGADLKSIQEMMGHSSISSTYIYVDVVKKKISEAYKKFHPKA